MSETERNTIEFMSPGKWEDLKREMRRSCELIGHTIDLRVHETDNEFIVERIKADWVPKRVRLAYNATVPQIEWTCYDPNPNRGIITFGLVNGSVVYLINRKVSALSEVAFVLISCVTGSV